MNFKFLLKCYLALTKRYSMHAPEPVGMYAASFLQRRDWDHN
jgi:hypothetical protein